MLRTLSASVSILMILGATPAAGWQRDTTQVERDSTLSPQLTDRLAPITVTGVLYPTAPHRLGFALSTVTPEQLRAEPKLFAADVLRTLPSAFIDEATGPGGPTIVRLRGGEEVFTQILMDGVQLNENGGFFDFLGFTPTNIERIEVARGPQSALYGSSAVSGVVHFITRSGMAGRPRFELTTEGGGATENGGSFRTTLTASGGTEGVRYSAGGGLTYARGIQDLPHDTWAQDGSLRIDATPSADVALTGVLRFMGMESKLPVRDPGATRVPLDPNARNTRDRFSTAVHATFRPGSRWQHRVGASLYRQDFLFEDEHDDVAATNMFDFFVFDATLVFDADFWRSKVDYVGTVQPAFGGDDAPVTISYGAAWEREDLSNTITGDFEDATEFDRWSSALFGEVQTDLAERVSLVVGARLEKYEELDVDVTPRASVVVRLVPDRFALRGAVGRAFKAPNLQEQFVDNPFIASNPDLEPETSVSWEAGATWTDPAGRFVLAATYFRQTYNDLIRSVDLRDGSGRQINRNLGKSEAEGLELEASVRVAPAVRAGVAGSWLRTEILENAGLPADQFPVGEELPFRPDVLAGAYVEADLGSRLSGVVRGRYVGGQTVLSERFSGNRIGLDSYVVADLTARYRAHGNLTLFGRVANLFDTTYHTAFDRTGSPLTAAVGARLVN